MAIDTFTYRDWTLSVDRPLTEDLYKQVQLGDAEICNCGQCRDFLAVKEFLYPEEVRTLFIKLGVDINKEFEPYDNGDPKLGHMYRWFFHFVGKIVKGSDSNTPYSQSGYQIELVPINNIFQIGFTKNVTFSFFDKQTELIEIELSADLPWEKSDIIKRLKN